MPNDHKLVGGGIFLIMVLLSIGVAALVLVGLIVAIGILILVPIVIGLFIRALYRNKKSGGKLTDLVSRTELGVFGAFAAWVTYSFCAFFFINKIEAGQGQANAFFFFIVIPANIFLFGGVGLLLFFVIRRDKQEQQAKQEAESRA